MCAAAKNERPNPDARSSEIKLSRPNFDRKSLVRTAYHYFIILHTTVQTSEARPQAKPLSFFFKLVLHLVLKLHELRFGERNYIF